MTTGSADRGDRIPPTVEVSSTEAPSSALWVGNGNGTGAPETEPEASGQVGGLVASATDDLDELKTAPARADTLNTSAEASAEPDGSGAATLQEPIFATEVPEPVFYVPPSEEDVLPATSVVELAPDALNAVLDAEFGPTDVSHADGAARNEPAPPAPSAPAPQYAPPANPPVSSAFVAAPSGAAPPPAAPAYEPTNAAPTDAASTAPKPSSNKWWRRSGSLLVSGRRTRGVNADIDADKVLDILLGTRPTSTNGSSPHVTLGPGAVVAPPVLPAGRPPIAAPSAPAAPSTAFPPEPAFVTPPPPPAAVASPPPPVVVAPPPPPPVVTAAPVPPLRADPVSVAPPPPPAPAIVTPPPPPPAAVAPPPPPPFVASPASPVEPVFTRDEAPVAPVATPTAPTIASEPSAPGPDARRAPTFVDPSEWDTAAPEADSDHHANSAASMATEILSATPESPFIAEPSQSADPELITKDMTLIARGRRKRFRLR